MAIVDLARLSELFRERAQMTKALREAQREAQALTLEHNKYIREADQAVTDSGRQRARLKADRKGQESKEANARAQRLSDDLQYKEVEIADMIAALAAAAWPLVSADLSGQLDGNLAEVRRSLERIDRSMARVVQALDEQRAAAREQASLSRREAVQRRGEADAVMSATQDATATLGRILRDLGQQSRSLRAIGGTLAGQSGALPPVPVVQVGWEPGMAEPEPRSAELTADEASALPERVAVLLFASEPRDYPRLDLDKEIREISLRIEEARYRDRISLTPWLATEPLDLIPNVNRHKPKMIQFSGHNTQDGLLMMGPPARSEPLAADRLIQMLKWSAEDLRIVFFNVCDSEDHARAAAQFVDAAIGMSGDMHDAPARTFAGILYSGLAFGNSVERAFHQACAAIADEPDSSIPQLFFRVDSEPGKIVLVRPD